MGTSGHIPPKWCQLESISACPPTARPDGRSSRNRWRYAEGCGGMEGRSDQRKRAGAVGSQLSQVAATGPWPCPAPPTVPPHPWVKRTGYLAAPAPARPRLSPSRPRPNSCCLPSTHIRGGTPTYTPGTLRRSSSQRCAGTVVPIFERTTSLPSSPVPSRTDGGRSSS